MSSHYPTWIALPTGDEEGSASVIKSNNKLYDSSFQWKDIFSHDTYHILLLVAIFTMLTWPWIFFAIVCHSKGVQMNPHVAKVVTGNPHAANFFVTFIGSIVSMIVGVLFSISVVRFAQKWVILNKIQNKNITVFHVSLISAFRHHYFPWGIDDLPSLFVQQRWLPALLVIVCISAFTFVPSATTSLISPTPFNKTLPLNGTELDFATSAADCVAWFNANQIPETCSWTTFNNVNYTTCLGENQDGDILESGRNNILSLLSNNTESFAFSQLGAKDGLHFLGPLRGVLPIGPNGVPAFDTLSNFPLLDIKAAMASYSYTLELQGLISDISCVYDTQSPIIFKKVPDAPTRAYQYTGTCLGGDDILADAQFIPPNSNHSLGFWACGIPSSEGRERYVLYLRGRAGYAPSIGNITCTVSPIQPAVFPVTYQSQTGYFSSRNATTTLANTSTELIRRAIKGLGTVIYESQNPQSNMVAESVITFGVKSFGLPSHDQDEAYLRLYEAMFQGILEYEATYIRLIYSTVTDPAPPSSCIRKVSGSATYTVLGWFVTPANIAFLIPMTLINLASLVLALIAAFTGRKILYEFNPTDPRSLIFASGKTCETAGGVLEGWDCQVNYSEGADSFGQRLPDPLPNAFTVVP